MDRYVGKDLEAMCVAKNYNEWIFAEFSRYIRGNVAEVGAGSGNFSKRLLQSNLEKLYAFEPSNDMFPLLEASTRGDKKVEAIHGFFDVEQGRETFDTILYINVLEHVEDDVAEMKKVRKSLGPGGHLLVFVPALPFLYSNFDEQIGHFRRYTKTSLVSVVEQAGLTIEKVRYFDCLGILPWYVHFTLLKNTMTANNVSLYDKYAIPVNRFCEKLLTPPIGKNLLLVAKTT